MWQVNDWWTDKFQTILKIGLESKEIQSRWSFIVFLSWEWRTLAKFIFLHRHIALQLNLGFFEFCIRFGSCRPNNFWIMHVTRKKDWKDETDGMVFCYQTCSDLLWEKIVLVIEKNFWNSRLKARIFKFFEITRTIYLNSERSAQFLKQKAF